MASRIEKKDDGVVRTGYVVTENVSTGTNGDASMRELLRQLADEGANLVRGEIALAKLELTETARSAALDGVKLVAAMAMAWIGALALTAALIIGLGTAIGNYWASALIVGVLLLIVGGLMAQRGIAGLKGNSIKPEATVDSMQENKRWAGREAQQFKETLKS
jgi:uncharacterized membrane protein YqjE